MSQGSWRPRCFRCAQHDKRQSATRMSRQRLQDARSTTAYRHGALLRPGRRRARQQRGDLRLLETARLTFMRDMGLMTADDGTRGISAGMTVSFLAESHWPGQVELGTGVMKIGTSSITVGSAAFKDAACIAAAEMTVVPPAGARRPIRSTARCGQSWKSICCQGFSACLTDPPTHSIFAPASKSHLHGKRGARACSSASAKPFVNGKSTPPSVRAPAVRPMFSVPVAEPLNAAAAPATCASASPRPGPTSKPRRRTPCC